MNNRLIYIFMGVLLFISLVSGCVSPNAVAPGAVDVDLLSNKMDNLEKIMDTKVDQKVFADTIGEINNTTDQKIVDYDKTITAKNIKYGGAAWVVVSAALNILIFLAVPIVIIYILVKNIEKIKTVLNLVCTAVKQSGPNTQLEVKGKINDLVGESNNSFSIDDKEELRTFTIKNNIRI